MAVQELKLCLQLEPRVADEQPATLLEVAAAQNASLLPDRREDNLYARTLCLPVALRDPRVFLKLLQLDLVAHPPGAPVCKLWITAEPARPRSAQRGLFLPVTPEAERLEITLARITGVIGERRAGIAKLLDTHRPDSFRMARCSTTTCKTNVAPCPFEVLTLRRYRRDPQASSRDHVDLRTTHELLEKLADDLIATIPSPKN